MVRVGPDDWTHALGDPDAREMDFTGPSMKGMMQLRRPQAGRVR
jgi:hypothetical protein